MSLLRSSSNFGPREHNHSDVIENRINIYEAFARPCAGKRERLQGKSHEDKTKPASRKAMRTGKRKAKRPQRHASQEERHTTYKPKSLLWLHPQHRRDDKGNAAVALSTNIAKCRLSLLCVTFLLASLQASVRPSLQASQGSDSNQAWPQSRISMATKQSELCHSCAQKVTFVCRELSSQAHGR